jgi:hypothetical protein
MISTYSDLTIKQYLQCKIIAELEPDPLIRKMKMLAEVSGKTLEWAESLPLGELRSRLKDLDQINETPKEGGAKMKFKIGGKTYKIKWRAQDMTGDQYIDATHFCKDPTKIESNIHNILSALAVECGWFKDKPYSGETHKERADLFFNEMKMKQAYPIMVFFCEYFKILEVNTLTYLAEAGEKLVTDFTQNGVGLQQ